MMQQRARRLAEASLIVFGGFAASRALGLVRNMVILNQFGTSREYEAFIAAIQIPDLVFQVLAGGAVASAFIPVFKRTLLDGEAAAWRLASATISLAVVATGLVALALVLAAQPVATLLVAGWDEPSQRLTADLMRLMLLSPVLFAASTFATSILNSFHRFALAAMAPLAYNLSIIAGAVWLRDQMGIYGLGVGVIVGAALHLLVQVPGLIRAGMRFRPLLSAEPQGVRAVLQLMLPRMVGLGVAQVNLLVNILLASFLVEGSIGYLNVAWLMLMSPLAVAMAISTAVFPTLAEAGAANQQDQLRKLFSLSLRSILFLTIPAAVGLMVLGEPLVRLFFERGQFTAASTALTAYALTFYALGLTGHGIVEIADRLFYALHDTRTPVLAACSSVGLNIVLSVGLMTTPLNFGGLALANSLAATTEAGLLFWLLRRRLPLVGLDAIVTSLLRLTAASLLMGILVMYLSRGSQPLLQAGSLPLQALTVGSLVLVGGLFYIGLAFALRCEEATLVRGLFRAR